MSDILGVSAGFHDAAIAVVSDAGEIKFAGHSERYSKLKNDAHLHIDLLAEVHEYDISTIAYYENPLKKQARQFYTGQGVEWDKLTTKQILNSQLDKYLKTMPKEVKSYNHHLSHAAAGFQTSPYDKATVVVIDAIGEWETITIWGAEYINGIAKYKKLWHQKYPHSIGLFYSAMTERVGLKPLDEEYILMGMSAYGLPGVGGLMKQDFVADEWKVQFKYNLHIGVEAEYLNYMPNADIAAGAQDLVENLICNVMRRARNFNWSNNLVYMGGVALNCLANRALGDYFENIWIMPNPGDAGSSLGAAALAHGKKLQWIDAYLGRDIPGPYPATALVDELLTNNIVGVASGRAEFGPRALGNRSLLADPRGPDIKDKVNQIKRRQEFRPFAPMILEEQAEEYFQMPPGFSSSPYMQSVGICLRPDKFPAIVHVDGSSRVQTVPKNSNSGVRELLEKWFVMTGCPMLLNTSLNIRGEPIVNDRDDADRFEKLYGIKVLS